MVFLPLSDDDPLERETSAPMMRGLILVTCLVFLWQRLSGPAADAVLSSLWGVVPDVVRGDVPGVDWFHRFAPLATYPFLHGGWLHLLVNMLFLWIFGDNVEDATSSLAFLFLYVASGVAGALLYVAMSPDRADPLIGASGAVAGVLGAYLLIRPCATVRVLFLVVILRIRAAWVIAFWMFVQVWNALAAPAGNVAWWAHVGGALAGAALIVLLRAPGVQLFACMPAGGRTVSMLWTRRD